jgi:hypothetical protein
MLRGHGRAVKAAGRTEIPLAQLANDTGMSKGEGRARTGVERVFHACASLSGNLRPGCRAEIPLFFTQAFR